jgi:hypothetical protein
VSVVTLLALLLIAHGLVHVSLNAVPYSPTTPFWPSLWRPQTVHSWLVNHVGVGAAQARLIGGVLLIVATTGFVLAGLAVADWLIPHTWWRPVGAVAASASMLLFALFPHPWLVVGAALSLGTLCAILVR